ncbi:MAG: nitroreductase family protein [Candidatus Bathyarchaeia archaeon]
MRRSIRSFKSDDISNELLKTIVDAARYAPSGGNIQPWLFVIIKDVEIKQKIHAILRDRMLRYLESPRGRRELEKYGEDLLFRYVEAVKTGLFQRHVIEAPVLIAVFGNVGSPYYIHDCCAATENLILAAHSLGLESCWIDHGIGDKTAENQIKNCLKFLKTIE